MEGAPSDNSGADAADEADLPGTQHNAGLNIGLVMQSFP